MSFEQDSDARNVAVSGARFELGLLDVLEEIEQR
jgi:hypothetical protein